MKFNLMKIPNQTKLPGLILICIFIMTGCKQDEILQIPTEVIKSPTATQPGLTPAGESQASTVPTPEPTLRPTTIPFATIHYTLWVEIDYPNRWVLVEEKLLIPHPSSNPLTELVLVVPPQAWPQVFSIQELVWGDNTLVENYVLDGIRLTIPLEQNWETGENLSLTIRYSLDIPLQNARQGYGPSPFGYTTRQTNLVDWYPMVPPYQDDIGWIIHDPWIFGESLVYPAADFEVSLKLNNPGLVVAASSAASKDGDLLNYSLKEARNFVFSISPDYTVLEAEVNGIKVYGYIFPGYRISGEAAFNATLEALDLYSDLFGLYAQSSLSMVQADFNHGMEYEGLYFQSRGFFDTYAGSVESYLVAIAVHETAHQWWYGQVANDQALDPWLDEALCAFSELIYYEQLYPNSSDWWWATRINYYEPFGRIDRSIYDYREYVDQYLAYRNATYLQGAKFLAGLKDVLGDELMYDFLREYAANNKNEIAESEDFFSLLNTYLDVNSLSWINEYFPE